MFYWLLIVSSVVFLALSISNPLYNLTIKKIINFNIFLNILTRVIFFILSIVLVFLGLYFESLT